MKCRLIPYLISPQYKLCPSECYFYKMPIRPQRHSLLAQSDSQSPTTTPSSNLIGLSGLTPPQSLEFESPTNLAASPREQRSNQQYDGVTGERIGESVVIIEPDTRDESHRYGEDTLFLCSSSITRKKPNPLTRSSPFSSLLHVRSSNRFPFPPSPNLHRPNPDILPPKPFGERVI